LCCVVLCCVVLCCVVLCSVLFCSVAFCHRLLLLRSVLLSFGIGLTTPALLTATSWRVGPEHQAKVQASLTLVGSIGTAGQSDKRPPPLLCFNSWSFSRPSFVLFPELLRLFWIYR
jgi:hypothetical protein